MRKVILLLFVVVIVISFSGCDFVNVTNVDTPTGLSVVVQGEGSYTSTYTRDYAKLTADADDGWEFDVWSGDITSSSKSIKIDREKLDDEDINVIAIFVEE